jgi:hypothetical protein
MAVSIYTEVLREQERLRPQMGPSHLPSQFWLGVLTEDLGRAGVAAGGGNWQHYRSELLSVAALAVMALEQHDTAVRVEHEAKRRTGALPAKRPSVPAIKGQ